MTEPTDGMRYAIAWTKSPGTAPAPGTKSVVMRWPGVHGPTRIYRHRLRWHWTVTVGDGIRANDRHASGRAWRRSSAAREARRVYEELVRTFKHAQLMWSGQRWDPDPAEEDIVGWWASTGWPS